MAKVLMIEDDFEITLLLEQYLKKFNISTISVSKPSIALNELKKNSYDLILLDLGLPEMDGLELCKLLKKEYPQIPIIISTARADVTDKVVAFDNGADDYMPKPYEPRELVARIEALTKRYKNFKLQSNSSEFSIDKVAMQISKNNEILDLTMAEYEILAILLEKKHQVVSREEIVNSVNSLRWDSNDRSIDVIISRIRHKIKDNPKEPKYIKSIRGIGYKYIGN